MEFGPARGHFLLIFDNFFRNFGLLLIAIVAGLFMGDIATVIKENIYILIFLVIAPCAKVTEYLTTRITVTSKAVFYKTGWINKKEMEIPAISIATIDYTQSLVQQVFGVYKVTISNSSNMASDNSDSVISMVFKKDDADRIAEILGKKEKSVDGVNIASSDLDDEGRNRVIMIPVSKILLLGVLKKKTTLVIEGIALLSFAGGYLGSETLDGVMDRFVELSLSMAILAVLVIIFALFLLELILTAIKYYGFTVSDKEDSIGIQYGLFTKKKFSISKVRISGYSYEQSFLMRIMGVGTLSIFAVGFAGDSETPEKAIVHPLIRQSDVMEYMSEFSSLFDDNCELNKAPKGTLRYFFYRPSFYLAFAVLLVTAGLSVIFDFFYLIIIGAGIVILSAAGRIQEYYNTRAGGNEKQIVLVSGGFVKRTTYIRSDNVESVTAFGSRWKLRNGITNICIDFLGDDSISTETVYNLDESVNAKLSSLMIY